MRTIITAAILLVLGCCVPMANACDTPVFRYAMYKWAPAPYEIYYFFDDEMATAGEAVQKRVDTLANQLGENANVVFTAISSAEYEETAGKTLPVDVRRGYEARKSKGGQMFAVYSPIGQPVHWGELATKDVDKLCQSPARQKVTAALASGDCCVYVILDADPAPAGESPPHPESDAANETLTGATAENVLKKMLSDLQAGELELLSPPPKDGPVVNNAEPVEHTAAIVRVSRSDPAEAWFVKTLLGIEPDLTTFNEPMVFPVFGRGRALPPFIGRGIRGELLIEAMEFATGACSCTVKDQNPGVDLLMTEDWEAAAEKLAARFGAEEGNEGLFADVEFLPEILVPDAGDNEPDVNTVGLVGKSGANDDASPSEPSTGKSNQSKATNPDSESVSEEIGTGGEGETAHQYHEDAGHEDSSQQVALADGVPGRGGQAAAFEGSSKSWGMLAIIGIGVGVGLLALMGATFIVARPK